MRLPISLHMRSPLLLPILAASLLGCSSPGNTDTLQQHTADATAAAKRDAGAIAKGVVEGLRRKGPLDLNTASEDQLSRLPGLTSTSAAAIVAGRPYTDLTQLVRRRILSKADFERIRSQIFIAKQ